MNTDAIRLVDFWIGVPLCFLLTLLRRVLQILHLERPATSAPRKVLFIKLIEQGATVLACHAIRHAENMVGRENVYMCVFEKNRGILDVLQVIPPENIFVIRSEGAFVLLWDVVRFVFKVRRSHVDSIVDLEFFARGSAVLSYLCGGTHRAGLHRFRSETPYRGDLMTHRLEYNPYIHTAQAYMLLVEALEHDPAGTPLLKLPLEDATPYCPRYTPSAAHLSQMQALLHHSENESAGPIIVLNPNTMDLLGVRKWPEERYIALAQKILSAYPKARIVITGIAVEKPAGTRMSTVLGNEHTVDLTGKTDLPLLLTLFSLADVLVTNDSGAAHFASTTPIHSVVFFGPETPDLFGPLGPRTHVMFKHLSCSPCLSAYNHRFSPCDDNVCVHAISVDAVYEQVCTCLLERGFEHPKHCKTNPIDRAANGE